MVQIIIYFSFSGLFQIVLLWLLCLIDILHLILKKPFTEKFDQVISLINSFTLLVLYLILALMYKSNVKS